MVLKHWDTVTSNDHSGNISQKCLKSNEQTRKHKIFGDINSWSDAQLLLR